MGQETKTGPENNESDAAVRLYLVICRGILYLTITNIKGRTRDLLCTYSLGIL